MLPVPLVLELGDDRSLRQETIVQRYLFELCAFLGEAGVERRSPWISDEWLAEELARDPNLDRLVEVPDSGWHPLPWEG